MNKNVSKSFVDRNQVCFVHEAVYVDSRDLAKRTVLDKILKDTAYEIALNSDWNESGLARMMHEFFW